MATKRKKSRKSRARRGKQLPELTLEQRETQARQLLAGGKHREAIAQYKELLRQERRHDWVDALAEAYAGRANGLAAKGMIKEAIAIWRNRAETCDQSLAEPDFLALLFQDAQFEVAGQLIRQQFRYLEEAGKLPRLRELCAAQLLAGRTPLLDLFPEDDPLRRDYPVALTALEAYCLQQDDAVLPALQALPFRSPFRDFRQLLKALMVSETEAAAAHALLSRIDTSSPFHSLASAIAAGRMPAPDYLHQFARMSKAERRLSSTLRGIPEQQLGTVHELQELGEHPRDEKLLRFLLRHSTLLGDEYVRESAMRLLVQYPRGETLYTRALGALSLFDRRRIAALREEVSGHPDEISDAWYEACVAIDRPDLQPGTEDALVLAMVLRHMADQRLETEAPAPPFFAALERALECDPEDRPASLQLIRLYLQENRLKDARRVLEPALERYPADTGVLTAAVETAIAGKAFKKATRFARRVLELDPINPAVRDMLCNAHVSHARKLIHQGKHPLAHRELEEADSWARSDEAKGKIDFARAMLMLDEARRDEACRLFLSGYERSGGGLVGHFQLLVAAGQLGRHGDTILKLAGLPKLARKADREQILALVHALGDIATGDEYVVMDALDLLDRPLAGAARLDFTLAEMTNLCETWSRLDQQELRAGYARAALRHWPDTPVFVLHYIEAEKGSVIMASPDDIARLDAAYDRAHEQGDMRTAHRIDQFMNSGPFFTDPDDMAFDPFIPDDELPPLPTGRELDLLIESILEGEGLPHIEDLKRQLPPEELRAALRDLLTGNPEPLLPEEMSGDKPGKARKRTRKAATTPNPDQLDFF